MLVSNKPITEVLIRLRGCAGWSAPVLFANLGRQVFSRRGPNGPVLEGETDPKQVARGRNGRGSPQEKTDRKEVIAPQTIQCSVSDLKTTINALSGQFIRESKSD